MPNQIVTAEKVAATALAMLRNSLVLGRIVHRDAEAEFGGGSGSTVNIRVPASLQGRSRALRDTTTAITVDSLEEGARPLVLTDHVYSAVALSDAEASLDILDYAIQVLDPMVVAVASYIENAISERLDALPADASITYDGADPYKALTAGRRALRDLGVTFGDLYAVAGTRVAEDLLNSPRISDASQAADNGEALHDATLAKLAGFQVVESTTVDPDSLVMLHRDAFTMAVRAPSVPESTWGASVTDEAKSYALRVVRSFDVTHLQEITAVSAFLGTAENTLNATDGTAKIPAVRVLAA